uniref:Short coiled-coil protein n=1 Tax=Macaca fascicularis TaxID=9541 RepID=A0A7N9CLR1_MACFA
CAGVFPRVVIGGRGAGTGRDSSHAHSVGGVGGAAGVSWFKCPGLRCLLDPSLSRRLERKVRAVLGSRGLGPRRLDLHPWPRRSLGEGPLAVPDADIVQAAKAAPGFVGESSSPQSPAEQVLGNHSSRILYPRHKSLLPKMMNADMDAVDAENQVELEEKTRLINQVLELQHTLEDLSARVDAVKEENLKLKSENQVLGQYIENLMSASSVFQTTDTKSKRK